MKHCFYILTLHFPRYGQTYVTRSGPVHIPENMTRAGAFAHLFSEACQSVGLPQDAAMTVHWSIERNDF